MILLTILGVLSVGFFSLLWPLIHRKGRGVSILIPFRPSSKAEERLRNVNWLIRYWKAQLPGAEVIIGDDPELDKPFSKSVAINRAAAKARGDVFVVVDADGYLSIESVMHCVNEIRLARKKGKKLWFVPYRKFFRLTEEASLRVLNSDPKKPYTFPAIPNEEDIFNDSDPATGHWYGAMAQIMPKEAFEIVGGWDTRFRGWGGEDHAAMRAMDTLYAPHKTLPGYVLHIWHPMIGSNGVSKMVSWKDRRWEGQGDPTINSKLSWRYYHAYGKPVLMRKLVSEPNHGNNARPQHIHKPHRRTNPRSA